MIAGRAFHDGPGIARFVLTRIRAAIAKSAAGKKRGTEADQRARSGLTLRETDVLRLLSRGYTYAEIGEKLGISMHTVTSHIKKSYRKLAVHTAAAAVTRAAELCLLERPRDS